MISLAVIVPVFNESGNIVRVFEKLKQVFLDIPEVAYSVLYVDDGSTDSSWSEISSFSLLPLRITGYFGVVVSLYRSCSSPPLYNKKANLKLWTLKNG